MHEEELFVPLSDDEAMREEDEPFRRPRRNRKGRRGRPRVDVFGQSWCDDPGFGLHLVRRRARSRLYNWEDRYPDLITSQQYRIDGHPDWDLYRAADLGMAVIKHGYPRPLSPEEKRRCALTSFDREAIAFIDWLRTELATKWHRRKGPRPDFRRMCKTALSTVVARSYLASRGQHYRTPPTPREIAQFWKLLFDEDEPYDSIKNRLPLIGELCKRFANEHRDRLVGSDEYFRKAGDCILRKLTPKRRSRSTG